MDRDLGLQYNRARHYDARVGRWNRADDWRGEQWMPASLHRYVYVTQNPINYADPSGFALFDYSICSQRVNVPDTSSFGECVWDCLWNYPGMPWVAFMVGTFLLNLKMPGEWRSGASIFTSLDRRIPGLGKQTIEMGAKVIRGTARRMKPVGLFGTISAAIAAFFLGYVVGASIVCVVECQGRD